ncbi:cellulase family glycosylhydrolase [Klebsiella aerogenes]|uniref:cellulase family glycosylhydrolase n=1 Tax=Klebsiella aerogenes TaxID=548 RepID=UPI00063C0932|nr:cellulase family glycosylhydrolase [Klebsiella aerogenes]KLF00326.1 hypothetical protein YA24_17000 [Klebsiella aerogenes]
MKKTMLCFILCFMNFKTLAFERGINIHIKHYPQESQFYIDLAKKYGFTSVRDDYPWELVQNNGSDFGMHGNLTKSDYFFSKKNELSKMMILAYGNSVLTKGDYPRTDAQIKAFTKYVSYTVQRYKGSVKYYEIWNEWLVGTGIPFRSTPPDANIFYKLVVESAKIIREKDPSAIIVVGSINPLKQKDRDWMDLLIAKGILRYVDGISLHPYSYGNPDLKMRLPENNLKGIDAYEAYLKRQLNKEVPLYISEFGYTSYKGANGIQPNLIVKYMFDYMDHAQKRSYIKGVWWYDLIDDGNNVNNKEHHFGILNRNLLMK